MRGTIPFRRRRAEDLFRWSAATGGSRTLSTIALPNQRLLRLRSSTGAIAQFNNAVMGGDFGDWQSSPFPSGAGPQVQDWGAYPGDAPVYGQSEIDALTAIDIPRLRRSPALWV